MSRRENSQTQRGFAKRRRRLSSQKLGLESLENRIVLAAPQFVSVQPNGGDVLSVASADVLNTSPRSLTIRFDQEIDGSDLSLSGIEVLRDGMALENVSREKGLLGNTVVLRFAETLPDDVYTINVTPTFLNAIGESFDPGANPALPLDFQLDLGTKVSAVVPQPVVRDATTGALSQALDQVEVYFNHDQLDPALVGDPSYYRLILTQDTVTNTDDGFFPPTAADYVAAESKVVLTFADDLHNLAGGGGTFRLRVGTNEADPSSDPLVPLVPATEPGDSFDTAFDVGALTEVSQILQSSIDSPEIFVAEYNFKPLYGAKNEVQTITLAGVASGTFTITYDGETTVPLQFNADQATVQTALEALPNIGPGNVSVIRTEEMPDVIFIEFVGDLEKMDVVEITVDDTGLMGGPAIVETVKEGLPDTFANLITEAQKQRVREAIEILNATTEGNFVETDDLGLTIVTGVPELAGDNDQVLSNALNWNDEFLAVSRQGHPSYFANFFGSPINRSSGDIRFLDNTPEAVFNSGLMTAGATDVDLYQFEIAGDAPGLFAAEIVAERQDAGLLDSVLRLYRESSSGERTLISQNDDYFSEDAFLSLSLEPGIYYIGVSAAGNDNYDPAVINSGFGGTSAGEYELRLDFRPEITDSLADTSGVALDGDGDGTPGGAFNFWFRAAAPSDGVGGADARVIYVDKADTTPDSQPDVGTLANPYNVVHAALNLDIDGLPKSGAASDPNAAQAGDIVRILGNGDSPETSLPYQIGRNAFNNQPLEDGGKLDIPNDVTVMVDAGAVFKMRRSAVVVGSTAVGIDHSLASFQVLGTPERSAVFTSINDFTGPNPSRGDWGGILFAGDLDQDSFRQRYEELGIFLNSVTHAEIRFGGGIVNVGSVPQEIAPIDIRDVRPAIRFNDLMTNAVGAISATPDSFEETNFHSPEFQATRFTSDYARVGPEIQDNRLFNNTINGLFVRIETRAGDELQKLTTSARFDDADIVHVLSEVLEVRGTPGGPLGNMPIAREDARLAIDPSVIVKLDGARIETGVGAQLIAEGNDGQEVIFTSINDDRFGASGTFDTSNNALDAIGSPGDWGGIYVGHSSSASIDHALLTFGGGDSAVEGRFVGFNVVEIQQGKARIANSTFIHNASGFSDALHNARGDNREGRGINGAATIFVRGAQPVILHNAFLSSGSTDPGLVLPATSFEELVAPININANSLNRTYVTDYGRTTGQRDALPGRLGNQGPLIRHNRLEDNDVNGMVVRGETLNGEGVWDDTDIVHVLYGNVHVPNFGVEGGLRLESTADESLVVKLGGFEDFAGFDATGRVGSNSERIGGTLHVIGQPGRPVVMTSIADTSAGAGMRLDGSFQNETLRPGLGDPTPPETGFSIDLHLSNEVALNNPVLVAALEEGARFWEERLTDNITIGLDVFIENLGEPGTVANASANGFAAAYDDVIQRMQMDAAVDESDLLNRLPTFNQLTVQGPPGMFAVDPVVSLGYPNAKALGYDPAPVPSMNVAGATRDGQINVNLLVARSTTIESFVSTVIHEIGHTLGFSSSVPEDGVFAGSAALSTFDLFRMEPGAGADDFTNNPRTLDPAREQVVYDGGLFDPVGIDIPGLTLGDIPVSRGSEPHPDDGQPSHWRSAGAVGINGINLGVMSPSGGSVVRGNDLRMLGLMGWDLPVFSLPTEPAAGDWRGIQLDELTNDRNVETVTELESSSSDASGANSIPDRAEFIGSLAASEFESDENLRLGFEIHGVLNARDDIDVYSFEGIAGTEVYLDIDYTTSSLDAVLELIDADGQTLFSSDDDGGDAFSTNLKDPSTMLILPGQAGTRGTYFVRVSSDGGLTQGAYELNIRLRDIDEVPGTTVRYADIRYARNGIEATGLVAHSQLQAEFVEPGDTATFDVALNVGSPFETDRGEISISGTLEPIDTQEVFIDGFERTFVTDGIDWYQGNFAGSTLDLDFANGIDGPDVHIAVYQVGTTKGADEDLDEDDELVYDLVYFGDGSNIDDDQGFGLPASSFLGHADPFISSVGFGELGPQILPDGTDREVSPTGAFIVAVTSQAVRPQELVGQYSVPAYTEQVSTAPIGGRNSIDLAMAATPVPFELEDVALFVVSDVPAGAGVASALQAVNPFTGEAQQGQRILSDDMASYSVASLGMRPDGSLFSLSLGMDSETSGNFLQVDWANPVDEDGNALPIVQNVGDDMIGTFIEVPPEDPMSMDPPTYEDFGDGIQFFGMQISDGLAYGVGERGAKGAPELDMPMNPDYVENIVYQIDAYPAAIDFNDTAPGEALPAGGLVREDDENSPTYFGGMFKGALTDIVELAAFNTPGEIVQGLAEQNGVFFGVTNAGGLYSLVPGTPNMDMGMTSQLATVPGASFSGLSFGPADLQGGLFADVLFAITTSGDLHAFDTSGNPLSVFDGMQSTVSTGIMNAQGLSFSTLDENLWSSGTFSAMSDPMADPFFSGNESLPGQFNRDYNFPGGAHGAFDVDVDLTTAAAEDLPFFYFDYQLRTELPNTDRDLLTPNSNDTADPIDDFFEDTNRDTLRVYATTANPNTATGADWVLLGSNNRPDLGVPGSRPPGVSETAQEFFDNSRLFQNDGEDINDTFFRQARIPLSEFAGNQITLRFEFASEGTFYPAGSADARPGHQNGDYEHTPVRRNDRTDNQVPDELNNAGQDGTQPFLGVQIQNVFFGNAERGELVLSPLTTETADGVTGPREPRFVFVGGNFTLVGEYQLFARGGASALDTNEALVGDTNLFRDQGQLILQSNRIVDSEEYGIRIEASPRIPAAAADLVIPNTSQLVRGPVVQNNLVWNSGIGGILFTGDETGTGAVTYGRIVSNTVVGSVSVEDPVTSTGIEIGANTSPTLLNNLVAYTQDAITVETSSMSTVIAGSLFHANLNNGETGQFPIFSSVVTGGTGGEDGLFRNPQQGNFLLVDGAVAIDSAINAQEDRPGITSVTSSLGLDYFSPILAPNRDLRGQLRVDDPDVESPPGLGSNVIKDRGAIERADRVGPRSTLLEPADNSSSDLDPAPNTVRSASGPFDIFRIGLVDVDISGNDLFGVGIDDTSVAPESVTVRRDDQALVQGQDYTVSYDSTSDIITVIPIAGVWVNGAYSIEINNTLTTDLAGNPLAANQIDGTTTFFIDLIDEPGPEGDYGDAPQPYPTRFSQGGAVHTDTSVFFLGAGVDTEFDGTPSNNADADTDDGVVFAGDLNVSLDTSATVTASTDGFLDAWVDFNRDGDWSDAGEQVFTSQALVAGENTLSINTPSGAVDGVTFARFRFSSSSAGLAPTGIASDGEVEDYAVTIVDLGTDYGDAPAPFATLLADDGARHSVVPGFFLGAGVDGDTDGQPSAAADGDGADEDGVAIPGTLLPGSTSQIAVQASQDGVLNAWIDFNADGDWSDVGEQIATDVALSSGGNTIDVDVPVDAIETSTYARFRFSTVAGLGVSGPAADGEVEDYIVNISSATWHNAAIPQDVNNNGAVDPLDALLILTELDLRVDSDPMTGALNGPANPPPFYDVDNDGFVSPLDALLVINDLPDTSNSAVRAPSSGAAGIEMNWRGAFDPDAEDVDDAFSDWGQI